MVFALSQDITTWYQALTSRNKAADANASDAELLLPNLVHYPPTKV
jgi:hypothetical protein